MRADNMTFGDSLQKNEELDHSMQLQLNDRYWQRNEHKGRTINDLGGPRAENSC